MKSGSFGVFFFVWLSLLFDLLQTGWYTSPAATAIKKEMLSSNLKKV
jgi:hypothetical protein